MRGDRQHCRLARTRQLRGMNAGLDPSRGGARVSMAAGEDTGSKPRLIQAMNNILNTVVEAPAFRFTEVQDSFARTPPGHWLMSMDETAAHRCVCVLGVGTPVLLLRRRGPGRRRCHGRQAGGVWVRIERRAVHLRHGQERRSS